MKTSFIKSALDGFQFIVSEVTNNKNLLSDEEWSRFDKALKDFEGSLSLSFNQSALNGILETFNALKK